MKTSGPENRAATRFALAGRVVACEPYGEGLIHDSFLVTCQGRDRSVRYLLQRINTAVFPDPLGLMRNLRAVADHLRRCGSVATAAASLAVPTLISAHSGADHYLDAAGSYWRIFEFLEGARALEPVVTPGQAELVGRAYGRFLRWLASYDGPELGETIPRFHDTEWRYEELERLVARDPAGRAAGATAEIALARDHQQRAAGLLALERAGAVPRRIVHNDAKPGNVLTLAAGRGRLSVVDLDTVMPGLALYDFGDLVRTSVSGCREDERDLARVSVREILFQSLAAGYLLEAGEILTATEREHLVLAAQVITLEQGLRFLTDYLAGDVYYKTSYGKHNLDRCRNQLRLLVELIASGPNLERIIADFQA